MAKVFGDGVVIGNGANGSTHPDHLREVSAKLTRLQSDVEVLTDLLRTNVMNNSSPRGVDKVMEVKLDTLHAQTLRGLISQHQETLKCVEGAFNNLLNSTSGKTKLQDHTGGLEGVSRGQLAELSSTIVAQILSQLREKLGQTAKTPLGDHSNNYDQSSFGHFYQSTPATPILPSFPSNPSIGGAYQEVSKGTGVNSSAGDVELDVLGLKQERMHMAEDHQKKLPNIELEEDSSLTGIFSRDTDVCKPIHKVEEYYHKTGFCQWIARSNHFANITLVVVMLNALYLAIDSDWNYAQNIYDADWPFQILTQSFCTYFTMELLIRFLALEKKSSCWKDGWFKFDLFLVSTMILDVWIIMLFVKLFASGGSVTLPTQPFRMLRLFKLTRMARLMKAFPELMTMIKGLVQSLRATASSVILLAVLVYTQAILLHLLLRDETEFNERLQNEVGYNFSSIGNCMWTLIFAGTLMLDNAEPMMKDLLFNSDIMRICSGILFVLFMGISALLILQMLIGVLCDVVSQINEERRDATAIGLVKQELLGYLQRIDKNGDGSLMKEEVYPMLEEQNAQALFRKLNINSSFFHKMVDLVFIDDNQAVPIRIILELLLMCRGDNPVNVNIIASTMCVLINCFGDVSSKIQKPSIIVKRPSTRSNLA